MDRLAELEVFVSIVDSGGFARAARKLRMSPAMVSTHLSRLETRLGVKLLDRTTRRIDLTQRGRSLLDDARHILGSLAAAEASVRGGGGVPSGRVRIDAPSAVGSRFIVPAIPAFRARYPQIVLDLSLGDRGSVLRPDRFDIVVRVGEPGQSDAYVQSLSETRFVHVASPVYLARRPAPRTPDDLAEHDCILYASVELQADNRWRFRAQWRDASAPAAGSRHFQSRRCDRRRRSGRDRHRPIARNAGGQRTRGPASGACVGGLELRRRAGLPDVAARSLQCARGEGRARFPRRRNRLDWSRAGCIPIAIAHSRHGAGDFDAPTVIVGGVNADWPTSFPTREMRRNAKPFQAADHKSRI